MTTEGYADAHCHLTPPWFKLSEVKKIVEQCNRKNVNIIVNSIITPENFAFALETEKLPSIYLTIGLDYSIYSDETLKQFKDFVQTNKEKIVAIGEIGLDHHWVTNQAEQEKQKKYFTLLAEFAIENNFPLVIHSRKAEQDAINILTKMDAKQVIMHCFDGSDEELKQIIDNNWYITVPTSAVYRKRYMKKTETMPLELLMFETDSPFHSLKHKENNTPCSIPILTKHVAKKLEMEEEQLKKVITDNVKKFYKIK